MPTSGAQAPSTKKILSNSSCMRLSGNQTEQP
jgi:hypothetical protein